MGLIASIKLKREETAWFLPFFCRDDRTRTGDPYVPNVVRYQLRYIPIALLANAKIIIFSELS